MPSGATTQPRVRRIAPTIGAGIVGGFALGIVARLWMRFIATDPEFTWGGTIGIVVGFTVFGLTHSAALLVHRRGRRRWAFAASRVAGIVGVLPLFVAAGGQMMPTVVAGGFALARPEWPTRVRAVFLLVALGPVVVVGTQLVGDFGWSLHALAGFVAMLAIYATIVRVARPTFAATPIGRHLPVWGIVPLVVGPCVLVTLLVAGVGD